MINIQTYIELGVIYHDMVDGDIDSLNIDPGLVDKYKADPYKYGEPYFCEIGAKIISKCRM